MRECDKFGDAVVACIRVRQILRLNHVVALDLEGRAIPLHAPRVFIIVVTCPQSEVCRRQSEAVNPLAINEREEWSIVWQIGGVISDSTLPRDFKITGDCLRNLHVAEIFGMHTPSSDVTIECLHARVRTRCIAAILWEAWISRHNNTGDTKVQHINACEIVWSIFTVYLE